MDLFYSNLSFKTTEMLKRILNKLEDPDRPLLGPNYKALKFWGLLLPENIYWKTWYMFHHTATTVFTATECIELYFLKHDVNLLLNNLKITMLATMSVVKVLTFLTWQQSWIQILEYVNRADRNQRMTKNEEKLRKIAYFTKYSRIITYFYWFLMYTTCWMLICTPPVVYLTSESYRNDLKNGNATIVEIVSAWVPFDKTKMPGYIFALMYQAYADQYGGGWITSFDTMAMVLMVFFRAELELLRIDTANIFKTENKEDFMKRLKDCHKRHVDLIKYARLFDSCLSPIMLLYMGVCSVMLCASAYQITTERSAMQRLLTTEYLVFGIAQLFIYCWHSNDVLYASQDLMLGPYESAWYQHDVMHRKDLIILTNQNMGVIVFSAGPFAKLTVATFINILKGAYSYYTILIQTQLK